MRRESVLPPCRAGPVCPAGANAVFCGGTHGSRPTHLVIASQSAPRSKCPWGTDWRGNPFSPQRKGRIPTPVTRSLARNDSAARPLDKSGRMGIIINRRGRCDKRSAPELVNDFNGLYSPQKPSPARVAVFAFQSLDSYRDRMTQNMNRKNEKHVCHPLSGL